MSLLLTRRAIVAAKIETTEGTAEALAAADANFLVVDPKFEIIMPLFERQNVDASLSPFNAVRGTQEAQLTFKVEAKGSGTGGAAPAVGKLLKGCGYVETISGVSSSYDFGTGASSSMTLALYSYTNTGSGNLLRQQMRGARGNVKFTAKAGEPGFFEFTFKGVYDGTTDQADLQGSGLEQTTPPAFLTANLLMQSFAARLESVSIDVGNNLAPRGDVNKAEGIFSFAITNRSPKGSVDPELDLVANHDFYGKWVSGVTASLSFLLGGTSGNQLVVTAPAIQYSKVARGDRGGVLTAALDFLCVRASGASNNELQFVFR